MMTALCSHSDRSEVRRSQDIDPPAEPVDTDGVISEGPDELQEQYQSDQEPLECAVASGPAAGIDTFNRRAVFVCSRPFTMQLDATVLTVFSAEIDDRGDGPVIALPEREVDLGDLKAGETYRVAIEATGESAPTTDPDDRSGTSNSADPPVAVGETHEVEIDDVGEEGDGVARVGPGYIVFVPDADMGDRVTIEITKALENFAFGEVVEGEPIRG